MGQLGAKPVVRVSWFVSPGPWHAAIRCLGAGPADKEKPCLHPRAHHTPVGACLRSPRSREASRSSRIGDLYTKRARSRRLQASCATEKARLQHDHLRTRGIDHDFALKTQLKRANYRRSQ